MRLLLLLPYLIVFLASLYTPSDPDLGWHLKYGEYFFQHGQILRDNTFSVMMSQYHWVNHSWGTDILTYAAFHLSGFLGLSILAAGFITATFFLFSKAARLSLWDEVILFPVLLVLLDPINNVSFRSQLVSLFFLGGLFYIISLSQRKNSKLLFLVTPLFFLWANMHGEFILGLGCFLLWMIFSLGFQISQNAFRLDEQIVSDIKIFILSFFLAILATLFNPFGFGVYVETLHHFGNPLAKYIAEWTPLPQLSSLWWRQVVMGIFIGFGGIFLFFSGKGREKFPYIALAIFLFFLPFWARRYAWPSYYLVLPILQPLSTFFKPDKKKTILSTSIILLFLSLCGVIAIKYPLTQFSKFSWPQYCQSTNVRCSPNSAQFLLDHKLTHNLLSLYGWGGWLIWNYPGIKPTIDGRMTFWIDNNGYSGFKDYYWYEQDFNSIDKSKYDVVYMSPDKPMYERMLVLVQEGKWQMMYQDNYAGIFMRK